MEAKGGSATAEVSKFLEEDVRAEQHAAGDTSAPASGQGSACKLCGNQAVQPLEKVTIYSEGGRYFCVPCAAKMRRVHKATHLAGDELLAEGRKRLTCGSDHSRISAASQRQPLRSDGRCVACLSKPASKPINAVSKGVPAFCSGCERWVRDVAKRQGLIGLSVLRHIGVDTSEYSQEAFNPDRNALTGRAEQALKGLDALLAGKRKAQEEEENNVAQILAESSLAEETKKDEKQENMPLPSTSQGNGATEEQGQGRKADGESETKKQREAGPSGNTTNATKDLRGKDLKKAKLKIMEQMALQRQRKPAEILEREKYEFDRKMDLLNSIKDTRPLHDSDVPWPGRLDGSEPELEKLAFVHRKDDLGSTLMKIKACHAHFKVLLDLASELFEPDRVEFCTCRLQSICARLEAFYDAFHDSLH